MLLRLLKVLKSFFAVSHLHKPFFTFSQWFYTLVPLFFSLLLIPSFLIKNPILTDTGPSWLGIDVSWAIAFNYAFSKGWDFGRDIVYTYGPLSFFATRCGYGISRWAFLAFDLMMVLNFFMVFRNYLSEAIDKFLGLITVFFVCLLIRTFIGVGITWILLFLVYFWVNRSYDKFKPLSFCYAGFLSGLSFFIKLNGGFIGILIYLTALANLQYHRKIKPAQTLSLLFIPFIFIGIGSVLLNVSLTGYIAGAYEMIKGYNEVMYLNEPYPGAKNGVFILFILMGVAYLISAYLLFRQKKFQLVVLALTPIIYLFILLKQATIRCDIQHLLEFHLYAPLILLTTGVLYHTRKSRRVYQRFTFLVFVFALLINSGNVHLENFFTQRFRNIPLYIKDFIHASDKNHLTQQSKRYIPQRVLQAIGNHSIDIIPWDVEYLLQHKLNYQPRPVFQSFAAYTPYLQELNAESVKKKAPSFLIYDYDATDGRYPFNEECLSNLFILKNYTLADTFISNGRLRLLLKKNEKTNEVNVKFVTKSKGQEAQAIHTNTDVDFMKINLRYKAAGKLQSIIKNAPEIRLIYVSENNDSFAFRTSIPMLKAGVFTNSMLMSTSDFANLIRLKNNVRVNKVYIQYDTTLIESLFDIELFKTNALGKILPKPYDVLFDNNNSFALDGERVIAIWGEPVSSKKIHLLKGTYHLTFLSKGTPAQGEFPYLQISINNLVKQSFYTSAGFTLTELRFVVSQEEDVILNISMTNDLSVASTNEDRNAFLKEFTLTKEP